MELFHLIAPKCPGDVGNSHTCEAAHCFSTRVCVYVRDLLITHPYPSSGDPCKPPHTHPTPCSLRGQHGDGVPSESDYSSYNDSN